MIEAALSGSVLILIILALRAAFRKRIPQRVQYALWGLVLLRLCLPFPLFESRLSVLEAVPDAGVMQREIYVLPIDRYQIAIDETPDGTAEADDRLVDANSFGYSVPVSYTHLFGQHIEKGRQNARAVLQNGLHGQDFVLIGLKERADAVAVAVIDTAADTGHLRGLGHGFGLSLPQKRFGLANAAQSRRMFCNFYGFV